MITLSVWWGCVACVLAYTIISFLHELLGQRKFEIAVFVLLLLCLVYNIDRSIELEKENEKLKSSGGKPSRMELVILGGGPLNAGGDLDKLAPAGGKDTQ